MSDINQIQSINPIDKDVLRLSRPPKFANVNLPLIVTALLLVGLGLLCVYSATLGNENYSYGRQILGVILGVICMAIVWRFDYRLLAKLTTLLLIINIVLILSPHIPFIGVTSNGARSWIRIGTQIQPGEFAKITVILLDASVIAKYGGKLGDPHEYIKALAIMLVPFLCIMTQPDMGTGLIYLFIAAIALIVGGARIKYLLLTLLVGVILILVVLGVDELIKYQNSQGEWEYRIIKNYQRNRFLIFINPDLDTTGSGYNLKQAQIAIGSGGIFGKGLTNGTQTSLNFLPEAPTDFIFCVLAEELGFIGAMFLLILYVFLIVICIRIAKGSMDMFGTMIVMCIVGMWLFQILENIGMTCGLMPITGIPLPFMSYGSSFMVVNFVMLGLIGSVWLHSNVYGMSGQYELNNKH